MDLQEQLNAYAGELVAAHKERREAQSALQRGREQSIK